ncbi:uncharacterized protein LOC129575612 isoform X2 [Sitodiplosis mosellana]|uniref:uncharacterized protein LOC129575612 isoform X2 n=1 Tax=Sitodiplosis mosellana TaxID=263140 RepID=UPI00244479ED|nr:uncharacterized protein LOC129575612 isoform X2 [Sitodiplosis mosellana]
MKFLVILACIAAVSADVSELKPTSTPAPAASTTIKPVANSMGQDAFASFSSSLFPSISTYSSFGALSVPSLTTYEFPSTVGPTFAPIATAAPFISATASPLVSSSFLSAPSSIAYDSTFDSHYSLPSSFYSSGLSTGFSGYPGLSGLSGFPGYYSGYDSIYGGLSGIDSSLFPGFGTSTSLGSSTGLGSSTALESNQNSDDAVITDAKQAKSAPTQKSQESLPALSTPAPATVKPIENFKPAELNKPTEAAPDDPEGNDD